MFTIRFAYIEQVERFLDVKRFKKLNSKLFKLIIYKDIVLAPDKSDLPDWAFSDYSLRHILPTNECLNERSGLVCDFTLFVCNLPLQDNHYSRIIDEHRVVVTTYQLDKYLIEDDIPIENLITSLIYTYYFVYKVNSLGFHISDEDELSHDIDRGCIFDMCGIKENRKRSCIKPYICHSCIEYLTGNGIENNDVIIANKELSKVDRTTFYKIKYFIKKHPNISMVLSFIFAVIAGIMATAIWEGVKSLICRF